MYHPAISDTPDLLTEWRWLLGGRACLLGWSASGDLFYADERGAAWRLDAGGGEAERAAASRTALEAALAEPASAAELLLLPVVAAYEAAHGTLGHGSCLGYTILPVFGGAYTADNRYALPVAEYAAFTGDVHRQIRDLPERDRLELRVMP